MSVLFLPVERTAAYLETILVSTLLLADLAVPAESTKAWYQLLRPDKPHVNSPFALIALAIAFVDPAPAFGILVE